MERPTAVAEAARGRPGSARGPARPRSLRRRGRRANPSHPLQTEGSVWGRPSLSVRPGGNVFGAREDRAVAQEAGAVGAPRKARR